MKPVDRRLLLRAAPARHYLVATVLAGTVTAGLVVAQASLLAHVIVHARSGVRALETSLVALLAVLVVRGLIGYLGEVSALRAAAAVRSSLRRDLAAKILSLGPAWSGETRSGSVAALMTKGLDSLDGYFARYLPQLVLACVVPAVVLARVGISDLTSAVVIGLTIPLIPVFMILIGLHTRARTDRQWHQLSRLSGHFLDVVEGLPTLKVFGRAKAQVSTIRSVCNDYRRTTMATLRVAFLSALVLELLATLATALVAVEIGLRLLHGGLSYSTALLVLLLTPEAYLPLRAVGASFHASADGVAAISEALDILDTEQQISHGGVRCDLRQSSIALEGVSVRFDGRETDGLRDVSLSIHPGDHVVVTGASGSGKSTLLSLLLGFRAPTTGAVLVDGIALDQIDVRHLRGQIAWLPQAPHVFAGTIADNVRIGRPEATDAEIRRAAAQSGLDAVVAGLPDGYQTVVGDRGRTLSTGQRQRLALTRLFLRDPAVLLLDEPAAHLDEESAVALRAAIERFAVGRTLVVVSHRPEWFRLADREVALRDGRVEQAEHRVIERLAFAS